MPLFNKKSPFILLLLFSLLINFILRIVLMLHPITQSHFSLFESFKIFSFGFLSDVFIFIIGSLFLFLYLIFLSDSKYLKPYGYIIFGLYLFLFLYILSGKSILTEYGGSLPQVGLIFIGIKTFLFGLLLFIPKYRSKIRYILFVITIFIYVLVIIQNAVSEFFFWNEFGVRYNFIAVDYLIYTNTVIGNIMESYPVIPLFSVIGLISIVSTFYIAKNTKNYLQNLPNFVVKIKNLAVYSVAFTISLIAIPFLAKQQNSENVFANELQANGIHKFYLAFMNSELEYDKFYKSLSDEEAFAILKNQIPNINTNSILRTIKNDSTEIHKNVVLITVESLSAEFLEEYGNEKKLTPFLDSLAHKSLQFTNLYAVGNRTVRGLESVTLCLAPTAGESVVKRKDNKNKFTTGSLFKNRNYSVKFLYGGDAYFDNMQDFFGGNDYEIFDKKLFKPSEVSFSNIWGVCDEDMYKKAITLMNEESKLGKPFFNHIMSVSNHRPFTYPEGKIDIPSNSKSRKGGVKYTDYALKQFFKMAEKQSWFKNTVYVILADHCASSSGKTELPINKYRIPCMIYSPEFIKPSECNTLMSQIDVMPTLFGLLNFSYESKFYGQDVFQSDYKPRALIATYQDLGLIKDNVLTVLSPGKKAKQFQMILKPKGKQDQNFQVMYDEKLMQNQRADLINETISYYQTTAKLLKDKKLDK
ncbi:LTA synthase family protein [Flavobacterium sp.]|uniref:LTA synthase family protein n=1 Tax=Flavobacterium sp. TaxID=239 RepID=UPI00261E1780|nr:LTA synthase family protein [Flavobacterium sp.]